ncbi:dehydrogenase [Hahella sp. CCB-MM4]|uniref:fatty acyl-CoA reductase n=1 Tax=Hahella sp. (strain CCB-MM4) TaxID=1926491 RepID=UPI000B9C3CC4|nr:fatty acyl-CoA reductase [Hahella sp. CCB-MM4]OZG72535.1 dehydrogenase [Hahella sp. CCB-MM4]
MNESKTLSALAGKNVLITGTTGFVGKVVLEKLLRSVPTIGKVYLLVRGNRSYPTAEKRFANEIAQSSIFETLKGEDAKQFQKLCDEHLRFVSGEMTEKNFGLSDDEFQELAGNIDLIINSAASVNFREALDQALKINTLCLHNMIALSQAGGDLPIVQVSTCYVNGHNKGVMEEDNVAPAGHPIERSEFGYYEVEPLIELLQSRIQDVSAAAKDDDQREKDLVDLGIAESNRYGWNDTYTFTKWMGEQLLMKAMYGKTLTILRPAIVESTLEGPVPGWIEGVKVADAIILAYAREKVNFFPGKKDGIIDIIPADLVSNSIILSAAEAMADSGQQRIYQCCSSEANPIRIKDVIAHVQAEAEEHHEVHDRLFYRKPQKSFMLIPSPVFNAVMTVGYNAIKLGFKLLEALGREPSSRMLSNLEATRKLSIVFSFYTSPSYTFSNSKLKALAERMGEYDRKEFPVDSSNYDWGMYLRKVHVPGLNRYALRPRRVYKLKKTTLEQQSQAA